MGRKTKQTVEYFPHFVADSKTKRILARYWGNTGYAFWFKLLELLCAEDGHVLNLSGMVEWEDFLAYTITDEATAISILNKLAELGKIDFDLWQHGKLIWCQSLVENLRPVYGKRTVSLPEKPLLPEFPSRKSSESGVSEDGNPQSKVEQSKPEERKEESPLPPKGEDTENAGESLSVETAEDTPTQGGSSKTRKPRQRKSTGILTKKQQERFEIFWQAYPNKKSPGQAEATFAKLNPDDDLLRKILAGIERAKKYDFRFRDSGRYAPYPSTWLNAKGWLDQFDKEGGDGGNGGHRQPDRSDGKPAFTPSSGFRSDSD